MTDERIVDLLHRRRDRAIAAVLGVKEREADPHLPVDAARRLRKAVLDQLNDFTTMVEDLLESVGPEDDTHAVVVNEHWLRQIAEMHQVIVTNGRP